MVHFCQIINEEPRSVKRLNMHLHYRQARWLPQLSTAERRDTHGDITHILIRDDAMKEIESHSTTISPQKN